MIHVVILVFAEPSADDEPRTFCRLRLVQRELFAGFGRVHRIVRFVAGFPFLRIFAADYGNGTLHHVFALWMIVFELVDPRERHVGVRVVHDARALPVRHVDALRLEAKRTPRQRAEFVVEERVYWTGVEHRRVKPVRGAPRKTVHVAFDRYSRMVEKPFEKRVVARERDALAVVREIVHVVAGADGKPFDDRSGKILRIRAPLLARVFAYKCVVQRFADERDGLLLEIGWNARGVPRLLCDERWQFRRSEV